LSENGTSSSARSVIASALAAVVVLLVCGCGATAEDDEPVARIRPLAVDLIRAPNGGVFDSPVWLRRLKRLVVTYTPAGGDPTPAWRNRLYSLTLDGNGFEQLNLPRRRGCRNTSYDLGRPHPDGRLLYLEECWGLDNSRRAKRLMAYDFRTQTVDAFVPYPLSVGANHYAIAPNGQRTVINDGGGLHERLQWLTPRGPRPVRTPFERAGYPAWSPNGRFIAVDAVPAGNDAEGPERLDLPRDLYLLGDNGEIKTTLLRNLPSAGASSWSPDSRRLALPMDPDDGPRGLYLVDTATGDVSLVLEGDELGASVWVPDGQTLVVATGIFSQLDESDNDVGLYKIRLPRPER
jgi:WD40-like Beta Propeller Repeat